MRKGRGRDDQRLTFSRTQLYLVAGCIIAIGVLSFSLGHLVSRESTPVDDAVRLEIPALPESEVLEEMKRLEQRLKVADKGLQAVEPAAKAGSGQDMELSFSEKLTPQTVGEPIKVKTIEVVERVEQLPLEKNVEVKAYKPIIRTRPVKAAPPAEDAVPDVTITETVEEPAIAPLAVEPEKEETDTAVASIKLKQRPSAPSVPRYTVQVASFPSEARANALARILKEKGYESYIQELVRTRSIWYRVRVGAYDKRWKAEKSMVELKKKEGLEGIILDYEKP